MHCWHFAESLVYYIGYIPRNNLYVKIIEETIGQVINNYSINKWEYQFKTREANKMPSQNNAVPTYIVFHNIGYHKGRLNAFQVN